jgi:hypothetical protein
LTGRNTRIRLAPNRLQFDEALFLRLLAGCVSIGKAEKRPIILAVPRLSQFQVDELMEIIADEVEDVRRSAWEWREEWERTKEKQARWWRELERELAH